MKNKLIIAAIIIAIVAGATFLFFRLYEYREEEIDKGYSKRAQKNPYLAATLFLEERGTEVVSDNRFIPDEELANYPAIFVANTRLIPSQARVDAFIQFVENGGHLIAAIPPGQDTENDKLLQYLGLELEDTDCDCSAYAFDDLFSEAEDDEDFTFSESLQKRNESIDNGEIENDDEEEENEETLVPYSQLTELSFSGMEKHFFVNFDSNYGLTHPFFYSDEEETDVPEPFYWAQDDYGVHFVQFYIGAGLVSILSDNTILTNREIGEYDNILLLEALNSEESHLNLMYSENVPSLFSLLRTYFSEFFIAGTILLLLWLKRSTTRFGPILDSQVTARRSIKENIITSAFYYWQHGYDKELFSVLTADIDTLMVSKVSNYRQEKRRDQFKLISDFSGCPLEEVEFAFIGKQAGDEAGKKNQSESAFTHRVKLLKALKQNINR